MQYRAKYALRMECIRTLYNFVLGQNVGLVFLIPKVRFSDG